MFDRKDLQNYSLLRAIRSMTGEPGEEAGFEREVSKALSKKYPNRMGGLLVPDEIFTRSMLSIALGSHTGENVVATDLLAGSFINLLRNKMVCTIMGAQALGGLVGDVSIPKHITSANSYWLTDEETPPVEGLPVLTSITATPKTIAGFIDVSRQLRLQSSIDIENFMKNDLVASIATGIDKAAILGGGAGEPDGLLLVEGLANPAVFGQPTWLDVVNLEAAVDTGNALVGTCGYVTTPRVKALMKATPKLEVYGTEFLWKTDNGVDMVNGYRSMASGQVPTTMTEGIHTSPDLHALIFGDFSQMIICEWGTMELLVDPYTNSNVGAIRVNAFKSVDILIRHKEGFSFMLVDLSA